MLSESLSTDPAASLDGGAPPQVHVSPTRSARKRSIIPEVDLWGDEPAERPKVTAASPARERHRSWEPQERAPAVSFALDPVDSTDVAVSAAPAQASTASAPAPAEEAVAAVEATAAAAASPEAPPSSVPSSVSQLIERLRAEKVRVIDTFRKWDVDMSGQIDLKEFTAGMRALSPTTPTEAIHALFRELDVDRSGELDFSELKRVLRAGYDVELEQRLRAGEAGEIELDSKNKAGAHTAPPSARCHTVRFPSARSRLI